MKTALALAAAAALLGGCVSTYNLTLMPRDSGQLYSGVMENVGGGEGRVSVTIDGKTYDGTWVQVVSDRTPGYALGFGGTVTMDNPEGGLATALLQSRDGTGLRCEFRGGSYGTGGGRCRDDRGREYDVQLRAAKA
jgi:hypothetical protein